MKYEKLLIAVTWYSELKIYLLWNLKQIFSFFLLSAYLFWAKSTQVLLFNAAHVLLSWIHVWLSILATIKFSVEWLSWTNTVHGRSNSSRQFTVACCVSCLRHLTKWAPQADSVDIHPHHWALSSSPPSNNLQATANKLLHLPWERSFVDWLLMSPRF